MNTRSNFRTAGALLVATGVATACADGNTLAPEGPQRLAFAGTAAAGPTCEVIDFEGFSHGDVVTAVSLSALTLDVTVFPSLNPDGSANPVSTARAFGTNEDPAVWEDDDLLWRQPGGDCPACEGQGSILVIEHQRGFYEWMSGDAQFGGDIVLSGFASRGGTYYIKSFRAFDNEATDAPIRLLVDGIIVGSSSGLGDGTVETVTADSHTLSNTAIFRLGTPEADHVGSSGGIDDIRVCTQEVTGGDGCTLGYWKNHLDSWAAAGYDPGQTLEAVFDVPEGLGLDDVTLLQALNFKGGGGIDGAARLLLKQAAAAVLNAAHPDVAYGMTLGAIITQVNAALASGSRSTMLGLKDTLDGLNNAGCPLK